MTAIDDRTTVPLFAGLRGVWTVVGLVVSGLVGAYVIREDVTTKISAGNAATAASLAGIETRITELNHRFDMFEQKITLNGAMSRGDFRLWLFKAKLVYKDLPDLE